MEKENKVFRDQALPEGGPSIEIEKDLIQAMNDANNMDFSDDNFASAEDFSESALFTMPEARDIDHIDAIEKIDNELEYMDNDNLDDYAKMFLQVGGDYFRPEVFDEVKIMLESRLGMTLEDWSMMKIKNKRM